MTKWIDSFEDKIEEKMGVFAPYLDEMDDGVKKELLSDCLYDYCRVAVQLDAVNEQILCTGSTILNNKGNVQRNPDLMTQHQLMAEKNALLPKLVKHLPDVAKNEDDLLTFARV